MILVDTSVWVNHFNKGSLTLGKLLSQGSVLTHPLILGELACGQFKNRKKVFDLLGALPKCKEAEHEEVFQFIESRKIHGKGIGIVDCHLLTSALVSGCELWTSDKRLKDLCIANGVFPRDI